MILPSIILLLASLLLLSLPASASTPRSPPKPSFLSPLSSHPSPLPSSSPAFNTSSWFGAAYTPSPAGNQLWWYEYTRYAPTVKKELTAASTLYGFNTLRTFLHNLVFDASPSQLLTNIDHYLTLCDSLHIKPGFVFFDDCWDTQGATIPDSCIPVKGRHNGCWKTCPQMNERTTYDRFKRYVTDIITRFKDDRRVLFWEIYNEPNSSNFTQTLRNTAFEWAKAIKPIQPIISCWGDNPNTQIVDVHRYDSNFVGWTNDIFVNPTKGAVVTEGGSRWYQGYDSDAGSVKVVMTWLNALRQAYMNREVPFTPGMIISWELNVGNSHTRWHWSTPDGTAEPTIPWDAHMFPDQTPISYTEAGMMQQYNKGTSPFLALATFMPFAYNNTQDYYLTIKPSDSVQSVFSKAVVASDGIYEISFWPTVNATFTVNTHYSEGSAYQFVVSLSTSTVSVQKLKGVSISMLGSYSFKQLECGVITNGWNILRMIIVGGEVDVYLNPMYTDAILPEGVQPRLTIVDTEALEGGDFVVNTHNGSVRIDYASISKIDAYGEFVKLPGKRKAAME